MDTKAAFEKWWEEESGHGDICAGSNIGGMIKGSLSMHGRHPARQSRLSYLSIATEFHLKLLHTMTLLMNVSRPSPPTESELNGWIKCSERMPKVGDVVLTAYQGATNVGEMERSGRDYRYFTSIASGRELPADFWMPLPAAPKPESEE